MPEEISLKMRFISHKKPFINSVAHIAKRYRSETKIPFNIYKLNILSKKYTNIKNKILIIPKNLNGLSI